MKLLGVCLLCLLISSILSKKTKGKQDWQKKNIRDYNDADLERLYDQWEEEDEPLDPDELPEWDPRRPQPKIDLNDLKTKNPEELLKLSKKDKSLMIFVKVSGEPSKEQTEEITALWQTGLRNNHILADRFILEPNRAIFMFKDGSLAWDAKDFLIEQEGCEEVTIEQKSFPGKYSEKGKKNYAKTTKEKKQKKEQSEKKLNKKEKRRKKEKKIKNKNDKKEDKKYKTEL